MSACQPERQSQSWEESVCHNDDMHPILQKITTLQLPPTEVCGQAEACNILRVYGMSDVHLNNHRYPCTNQHEKKVVKLEGPSQRPGVVAFLDDIITRLLEEPTEVMLILNGDIFDITTSWPADINVLDMDNAAIEEVVHHILDEIVFCNQDVIERLRMLLDQPNTRICYVIGNHDRWLNTPALKEHLRNVLEIADEPDRFVIERRICIPEIGLLALHGDEFDPSCSPPLIGLNRAERIDMILLNGLVSQVKEQLTAAGYTPETVHTVVEAVKGMEYVRPVSNTVDYLYRQLEDFSQHPENEGKPLGIETIVTEVIFDSLAKAMHLPRFGWLKPVLVILLQWFLSFRAGQRFFTYYVSRTRRVLKDKFQLNRVKTMLEWEEQRFPVRIVYMGHTHRLLFNEIEYNYQGETRPCLVVNAGGHKKTIFFPSPDEVYPAGMMWVSYNRENKELSSELETTTRRNFSL